MAYIQDEYIFPNSIEVEIKWAGNYGAKGERRAPREKATPQQIEKQNQWKKENEVRRLLKLNFNLGDFWITLTYPQGTRKEIREVKKDIAKLNRFLRSKYKKLDIPFKWIRRVEIGSLGGIHVHMMVNQVRGEPIDMLIQERWHQLTGGRAHYERYQGDEESARKVGDYLVKPLTEQQEKILEDRGWDKSELVGYSTSRNLIRPEPVRKEYKRRTMQRVIETGEPQAREGYYIDKNSIVFGVNRFTGLSYLYYTELKGGGIT